MLSRSTIGRLGLVLRGNTTASSDIDSFQFPVGLFTLGYLLVFNCWPVSLFPSQVSIYWSEPILPLYIKFCFPSNCSLGFLKRYPWDMHAGAVVVGVQYPQFRGMLFTLFNYQSSAMNILSTTTSRICFHDTLNEVAHILKSLLVVFRVHQQPTAVCKEAFCIHVGAHVHKIKAWSMLYVTATYQHPTSSECFQLGLVIELSMLYLSLHRFSASDHLSGDTFS